MNPSDTPDAALLLGRLLQQRYSCRGFLPHPVPRAILQQVVELAQQTPSWCNCQPWEVIITSGEATDAFRQAYLAESDAPAEQPDFTWPREYKPRYLQRRRECGFALYDSVGVTKDDTQGRARQALQNFAFFGAPHVAIITVDEALDVYGAIDCAGYVNTFMLAAQALGVATIAQAALAARPEFIRRYFDLPPEQRIVCGISFGYADDAHPANQFRTTRVPLDESIRWVEGR